MINKTTKKIISYLLVLSIVVFSFTINKINISAHELTKKTNLNYISKDPSYTEYTYDENGISYKVIETTNSDLSIINTKIYQKEKTNNYILTEDFTTVIQINKDVVELTVTKDGTVEVLEININEIADTIDEFSNKTSNDYTLPKGSISTSGSTMLTSWTFHSRTTGSTITTIRTLTVLTAVICAVVATGVGGSALYAGAVAAAQVIADYIIQDNIPEVYYSKYVYYKYILNSNPPLPRAEKVEVFYYKDAAHTIFIGSVVNEYYVSGWY